MSKEIDQEVQYALLTETNRNDTLLVELYRKREPLILKRNSLVDKPFFLLRRSLREQVEKIDEQLDPIDLEIWKHRKKQI